MGKRQGSTERAMGIVNKTAILIKDEIERAVAQDTFKIKARLDAKERELAQMRDQLKSAKEKGEDLTKRLGAAEKALVNAREFIKKVREGAESVAGEKLPTSTQETVVDEEVPKEAEEEEKK